MLLSQRFNRNYASRAPVYPKAGRLRLVKGLEGLLPDDRTADAKHPPIVRFDVGQSKSRQDLDDDPVDVFVPVRGPTHRLRGRIGGQGGRQGCGSRHSKSMRLMAEAADLFLPALGNHLRGHGFAVAASSSELGAASMRWVSGA